MPMSKNMCYLAFKDVASKYLSPEQIADFMQEHEARVKEIMAHEELRSQADVEAEVAKEMGNEKVTAALLAKRNSAFNTLKTMQIIHSIEAVDENGVANYKPEEYLDALKHLMGGSAYKWHKGSQMSVSLHMDIKTSRAISSFLDDIDRANLSKYLFDDKHSRNIWLELGEIREGGKPGITGDDLARQAAEILERHQEAARVEANRQGANIEKLQGYTIAQTHDPSKLLPKVKNGQNRFEDGFEQWFQFIYPRLNHARTFKGLKGEAAQKNMLREIYTSLVSGTHLDYESGVGIATGGNRADRVSNSRTLIFTDANASFEYNQKYGTFTNLTTGYIEGLRRLARNSALIEKLGTNPEKTIGDLHEYFKIKARNSGNVKAIEQFRLGDSQRHWSGNLSAYFDVLTGKVNTPISETAAKVMQTFRTLNSMSSLGMATISSFSDIGAQLSQAMYLGLSQQRAFGNMIRMLTDVTRKGLTPGERALFNDLGLLAENLSANLHDALSQGSAGSGLLAKMQNKYFRAIGLDWWTTSLKKAMALSLNHELGMFFSGHPDFKGFNQGMRKALEAYSLGAKELEVLKSMPLVKEGKRTFIDIKHIIDIPDDVIAKYLNIDKSITGYADRIKSCKLDLQTRLHGFMWDRINAAVIEPDMIAKVWTTQGTQAGTIPGEIFRSFGQFKSFAISVITRTITPWLANASKGQAALGLSYLLMTTTALGYLSICCKEAVKGRTAPEMNRKTFFRALCQGGALGIIGDVLFGEAQGNVDLLAALEGPTFGKANDVYNVYLKAMNGDDAAAEALRRFRNWLPGQNIFYAKIPLDYLIMNNVYEWANPGYLQRLERNLHNKTGQEYWFNEGLFVK